MKEDKEDIVELIEYLRIIWKRKILIIVGTLICMVAVGVVSLLTKASPATAPPETYRAEAVVRIGNKITYPPPSSSCGYITTPSELVTTIPVEYGQSEPSFRVVPASAPSFLRFIMEGPGKEKTEGSIKRIIDKVIDDHLRLAESSIIKHVDFKTNTDLEIEKIKKHVYSAELELSGLLVGGDDPDLFVKLLNTRNGIIKCKSYLHELQVQVLRCEGAIQKVNENKTKMVGVVKTERLPGVAKKVRKMSSVIIMGAIVGLTLSMFLALFMEYINDARKKEKGDKDDRS